MWCVRPLPPRGGAGGGGPGVPGRVATYRAAGWACDGLRAPPGSGAGRSVEMVRARSVGR